MAREPSRPRGKAPTIKDVARLAGVSFATVSRVVNDSKPVNEPTRERVRQAIDALNYVPNSLARGLQTQESRTLGMILPEIGSSGAAQILQGAEDAARAAGFSMMLMNTAAAVRRELESLSMLLERQVDGAIWVAARFTPEHATWLERHALPIVALAQDFHAYGVPSVLVDNHGAAQEATEFILGRGHRRVAMIAADPTDLAVGRDRRLGYEAALRAHGLDVAPELVVDADVSSQESGYAAMARLDRHAPTAVLAASDLLAMGAMRYQLERGRSIPGDVSIMGFDDLDVASHPAMRLTTVAFDFVELGALATRTLIEAIERPGATPEARRVPHRLIVRDSVGAA
jgi:LacI family transcriptional regulator